MIAPLLLASALVAGTLWAQRRANDADQAPQNPEGKPCSTKPEDYEKLFLERLEMYRELSKSLDKNIYFWVILVGFALFILTSEAKQSFVVLDAAIPSSTAHVLVVVLLVYLWIEFGALLKSSIVERIALWRMLNKMEDTTPPSLWSRRSMLNVAGVLDAWFMQFLPLWIHRDQAENSNNRTFKVLLRAITLVGAAMCGLAQASAFAMLWDIDQLWGDLPWVHWVTVAAEVVAVVVMWACYMYFLADGHGKGFFVACSVCAAAGMISLPLLTWTRASAAPITCFETEAACFCTPC